MCENCVEEAVAKLLYEAQKASKVTDGQIITGLSRIIGKIIGVNPELDEDRRNAILEVVVVKNLQSQIERTVLEFSQPQETMQ